MNLPGEIPRVAPPSPAEFRARYVRARRPVVIEGLTDAWPARTLWTPESLAARLAAVTAPCFVTRENGLRGDARHGLVMERRPLAEVITAMRRGETHHRVRADLARDLPALAGDLGELPYLRGVMAREDFLWVTPAGATTAIHWDSPENLFAHFVGEKRFVLAPPDDARHLYPFPFLSACPQFSRAEFGDARFVELGRARWSACTLRPGDVLYIPSGWWHFASSVDLTVSASLWWQRPARLPWTVAYALSKRVFAGARQSVWR